MRQGERCWLLAERINRPTPATATVQRAAAPSRSPGACALHPTHTVRLRPACPAYIPSPDQSKMRSVELASTCGTRTSAVASLTTSRISPCSPREVASHALRLKSGLWWAGFFRMFACVRQEHDRCERATQGDVGQDAFGGALS